MSLIVFGIALFVVGFIMTLVGDAIRRRKHKRRRGVDGGGPVDPFFKWLLTVAKSAFKIMTDPDAGAGKKIAAAGSILMAIGIVCVVAGIGVALAGSGSDGGSGSGGGSTSTTSTTVG